MQKVMGLFLAILCFSLHANQAELLKKLAEQKSNSKLEQKEKKYEGVLRNGLKGVAFGFVANSFTLGMYGPYSLYRAAKLYDKKSRLQASDAQQFGSKSRQELERQIATREVWNRNGKVVGSLLALTIRYFFEGLSAKAPAPAAAPQNSARCS